MTGCAATSSSRTSSRRNDPPKPSPRSSGADRPFASLVRLTGSCRRRLPSALLPPALLLAALLSLPALGGCVTSTTFYGAPAHELHGKPVLLLEPSLLAPTSEALHRHVVEAIEAGLAASPELGPLTRREQVHARTDLPLDVVDAYSLYSNTFSLTGISDPNLAARLGKGLHVDLLMVAQPAYLPCSVCDQGDSLWLVGQVVEARSGRIVFRDHLHVNVPHDDPEALQEHSDDLMRDYLTDLNWAFHLRSHRQRFLNLKRDAAR